MYRNDKSISFYKKTHVYHIYIDSIDCEILPPRCKELA